MRALALLLLLAGLWLAPMHRAEAACSPATLTQSTGSTAICATQPEAYALLAAETCRGYHLGNTNWNTGTTPDSWLGPYTNSGGNPEYKHTIHCIFGGTGAGDNTQLQANWPPSGSCPASAPFDTATMTCKTACPTTGAPLADNLAVTYTITNPKYPLADIPLSSCSGGCTYAPPASATAVPTFMIDGTHYANVGGWVPTGSVCTTSTTTTPPTDTDGDGTSDSKDGSPNNPGSTGTDDPNDTDPTCGAAGQPKCPDKTDGSDHTSSGGGDCSTPPQSSGDPILGQIAFQTWATRCQLVKNANTGTGGTGGTVGGSTDMTATNSKLDGIKGDLDKLSGEPSDTSDGTGDQLGRGQGDIWGDGAPPSPSDINMTGFGFSRSCPAPPQISMFGMTKTIDTDGLCTLAGMFGTLILAAAAAQAAFIFAGKNA
jgi:hypothetical protein